MYLPTLVVEVIMKEVIRMKMEKVAARLVPVGKLTRIKTWAASQSGTRTAMKYLTIALITDGGHRKMLGSSVWFYSHIC